MMRQQSTISLVACNGNAKAYVLEPPNGQLTGTVFSTPSGLTRGSQISSTEAILGGRNDTASVISMASGTVTKTMSGGHGNGTVHCTVNLVSSDYPNPRVGTGGSDNCIAIWDVGAASVGSHLWKLQGHTGPVYSLVNHPFLSEFLFSGSDDGSIKQWDHGLETCVDTFTEYGGVVKDLRYDPNHQILFSGRHDNKVEGWDHRSGEKVIQLRFHHVIDTILYREESEENQLVVPVYAEKNHLFDLRLLSESGTTQELRSWDHGHPYAVFDICDVPDQNLFVTSGFNFNEGHIKAWRENGECVWDWEGPGYMRGLFPFVEDYEGWISATGPPRPLEIAETRSEDELIE